MHTDGVVVATRTKSAGEYAHGEVLHRVSVISTPTSLELGGVKMID